MKKRSSGTKCNQFNVFFVFVLLSVSQIFSAVCFTPYQLNQAYAGASQVSHNEKNYQAKWWTAAVPGSQAWNAGDWEYLGDCQEATNPKDTIKNNCFEPYILNKEYKTGQSVNYLGRNYIANWTNSETPGVQNFGGWEDLGICEEETIVDFRDDTTKETATMESVSQFLLFATDTLNLNSGVKIAGNIGANKKVSVGLSAGWQTIVNGDIYSKGKVSTSAEAAITGDVYAPNLELGWMARHDGKLFENFDFDFNIEKKNIQTSSKNYDGKWLEKINLPVGNYNNISVKDGGNLQLSNGVYNARTLTLNSNDLEIKLNISAGENVELNVQDSLHFGSGTKVVFAGKKSPLNFKIYTNQTNDLIIPDHSEINAIITAPNAKVIVNSGAKVNGAIYAKEIEVKYEAVINGVPYITDVFHSEYHFAPNFDVKTAEYFSVVSSNATIDFVEVNNPKNYKITKTNTANKYVFEVEDTISKLVSYYSLDFEFSHSDYAVFVNKNASNNGTGKSWATAINDLQKAIEIAKIEGKEIRVAEGTYDNIAINQGTKMSGGFLGVESDENPTGNPYKTMISGNNETQTVVIKGFENAKSFKIKGISVENGYSETSGGGISAEKVIPKFEEVIVRNNTAKEFGAGIYAPKGVQDLHMVLVENNTGKSAFYLENVDSVKAERVVVSQNSGIGLEAKNIKNLSFVNSIFYGNKTAISADSSKFEIIHNTFAKNDTGIVVKNSNVNIVNSILWNEKKEISGGELAVSYSCVKGGFSGEGNIDVVPLFVDIDKPNGEDEEWGSYDDKLIVKEIKLKGTKIVSENDSIFGQDILLRYRNKDNPTMGAYEYLPIKANTMVFGKMYNGEFIGMNDITIIEDMIHPKEIYFYSGSNHARVMRMYVENNEHTRKKSQIKITFHALDNNGNYLNAGINMNLIKIGEENGILVFQSVSSDYSWGKRVLFVSSNRWHNFQNDWCHVIQINENIAYRIIVNTKQFTD